MALEVRPEFKPKDIRSYVIRAGRITEGQRQAFDQYWPAFGLSLNNGLIEPGSLFNRDAPLVLEVGFGMGDSLLSQAKEEKENNFIGIEVHSPGVGRLIKQAGDLELTNLKVFMADALDVLRDCIPNGSLNRFQLYFPDPWHKKRHHKRRIVTPDFIALIEQKLMPGGVIHFATDWEDYAKVMLALLSGAEGIENTRLDGGFSPKPCFRPDTKFEKRGENLGHGVWDILFRKKDAR